MRSEALFHLGMQFSPVSKTIQVIDKSWIYTLFLLLAHSAIKTVLVVVWVATRLTAVLRKFLCVSSNILRTENRPTKAINVVLKQRFLVDDKHSKTRAAMA